MFYILWVIFQTLAFVVEGGVTSGSAEALAKGGVNNNGAAAGNNPKPGDQNRVPLNTEPLIVRLFQLGGSFFIQPVGNQVGQGLLQPLIPFGAVHQPGAFLVGQFGGANVNPEGWVAQGTRGGPVTLFAVLPQRNVGGDPRGVLLTPNQVHLFSPAGLKNQPPLGAAAGPAAARLRFQRSVAVRARRAKSPVMKAMAAEEEQECSGMEMKQAK